MSRSTTALKRLAVPGLAAATMFAGVPAFVGVAQAAPGDVVSLTPDADSASTGTCNIFTIRVTNNGQNVSGRAVDVRLTERTVEGGSGSEAGTADATFCQVSATGSGANGSTGFTPFDTNLSAGTNPQATDSATAADTDRAQFVTGSDGTITFGVASTNPQIIDVLAFIEEDNNNVFNQGETNDASVKTFTQGGDDSVTTVDATPETQTAFTGQPVNFVVTATNSSGDTVNGADIAGVIVSGPSGNTGTVSCADNGGTQTGDNVNVGTTNNNGQTVCTFTPTAAGTFTLRFFADQTGRQSGVQDTNEASDDVTATVQAAPTGLQVDLVADDPIATSFEDDVNDPSDPTASFTAIVTQADGADADSNRDPVAGVRVDFAVTGDTGDSSENGVQTATVNPTTGVTDANGRISTTVTEPSPVDGEIITITATIAGQTSTANGEISTDDARLTFNEAAATEARNINLTPESSTQTSGQVFEVSAVVTDINGNRVQGVTVTFTEAGDARFTNGTSSASAVTNSDGVATAALTSDGTGSSTVTASLDPTTTDCELAAVSTNSGAQPGATAGNCTDSETFTLEAAASPSPSATATASPSATPTATSSPSPSASPTQGTTSPSASPTGNASPPAVACSPAQVRLFDTIIIATGAARGEVRGTPNSVVLLRAYTRPSTTFFTARRIEVGADGVGTFLITPPGNTRMFAVQEGCTETSQQIVLNVRTQLSLNVERLGTQTYRFFGSAIPARPNGLIVSLYRVTDSGRQVLTSQVRANANRGQAGFDPSRPAGSYSITRKFTGTGRFGFVVRTGQDLQNAPGSSNVRSLLIF